MAVTASFAANTLSILGDTLDNPITVSRDSAGTISVNGGAVPITGGPSTTANTSLIDVSGSDGSDTIAFDETFGPLPAATVNGGRGNDIATLGSGDDTFVWNPGDGSDTVDGGGGFNTLAFNGANVAENIDISANGSHVQFTRDVGAVTMDLNHVEKIAFTARGGADNITVGDMTGTNLQQVAVDLSAAGDGGAGDGAADTVTVNGTNGADTITVSLSGSTVLVNGLVAQTSIVGRDANDALHINGLGGNDIISASGVSGVPLVIDSGDGNDTVTGSRGNDVVLLGADDDTFIWNPGDGSDTVDGGSGTDTLQFNGSNANEQYDISANGTHVRLTRDVGAITMDLNSIEKIALKTLGGADTVTVNDLTGTGTTQVTVDLSGSGGGGDGSADNVVVNGTAGDDNNIVLTQVGSQILVNGLAAQVAIGGFDAIDTLTINGLGGDDSINASGIAAGLIKLVINGGDGNDVISGSAGDDVVSGGRGNDVALLGGGNDTYVWNPGDGSDTVEGQAGTDTLLFNGANVAENIDISANGSRVRFTRDVGAVTMDLNGVEHITFTAHGGADHVTVGDMTGTDLQQVALDLSAAGDGGTGDGAPDTVTVNATGGVDTITVSSIGSEILVNGLAAQTSIVGEEAANDALQINALGGADIIDASAVAAGAIQLTLDGGDGNDTLIGSAGADILTGGVGDDTFVYRPGGGADIITDFTAGSNVDEINLKAFPGLHSLGDVLALATQVGPDTVLDFGGGDTLTLQGVTKTDLDASDFILQGPVALSVTTSGTGIIAGSGDLNAGHVVTLTLGFDEATFVAGGTPTLALNDGGIASFAGGSGSSALTFLYTVAPGENTADLAVSAIDLHGATLQDGSGNNADLAAAVTNPAGVLQIDTLAPQATSVSASPASGNETPGSPVTFTLAFSEAVNLTGGTPTLSLNDGGVAQYDAAATAALHDVSKLAFNYVVSGSDAAVTSLSVTGLDPEGAAIADLAGNAASNNVAATFAGLSVNPHGFESPPFLADYHLV